MISFSKVKESIIEKGSRILKVVQFGVKTADVVSPFGDDSVPLKDMTAIYANTSEVGDNIILGYINNNQLAAIGEKRIFSLKPDSSLSFAVHLKNDGTCEIGGDEDFAVRFNALNTALQNEVALVNAELTKIAAGIATAGGSYIPAPITLDLNLSRVDNVKLP
jgi:hypothetical protein